MAADDAGGAEAHAGLCRKLRPHRFPPDLAAFRVPTLVLHQQGNNSVPIDASGVRRRRASAQAQLVEYDGAPHGLFATEGDRLTRDLLAFLGR
ncbi:alpha/beta fold hydrolase [Sphingomonas sp. MMS24-JH45]